MSALISPVHPIAGEKIGLTAEVHALCHRKRGISQDQNGLTEHSCLLSIASLRKIREVNDPDPLVTISRLQKKVTCAETGQIDEDQTGYRCNKSDF